MHLRDLFAVLGVVTDKIDDLVFYDKSFFMQGLTWGTKWIGDFLYCWILQDFFLSKIEEPIGDIEEDFVQGCVWNYYRYGMIVDVLGLYKFTIHIPSLNHLSLGLMRFKNKSSFRFYIQTMAKLYMCYYCRCHTFDTC